MFVTIYPLKKLQLFVFFGINDYILPHLVFSCYNMSQDVVGIQKLQKDGQLHLSAGYVTVKSQKEGRDLPE